MSHIELLVKCSRCKDDYCKDCYVNCPYCSNPHIVMANKGVEFDKIN